MAALSRALGGEERTAYGLAGLGDLLTTGYSPHSRNRTLGEKLITDPEWREFVRSRTVEGVGACEAAHQLAAAARLATPLLDAIREALSASEPGEAMRRFLRQFAFG
jgi:glycerol-3-phosphate dehydrogenase (NAD(P)+)